MADFHNRVFKSRACLKNFGAIAVEHGKAAAATIHIAFICNHEMVCIDPLHPIRLARDCDGLIKDQRAFFLGVHTVQRHLTRREMAEHLTCSRNHNHVIVFLHRNNDVAIGVHINEFWFRVFWGNISKACQINTDLRRAIHRAIFAQGLDHQMTRRHLRHAAIA